MTTSGFGRMGIGMLDAEPYVPILSPLTVYENAKTYHGEMYNQV